MKRLVLAAVAAAAAASFAVPAQAVGCLPGWYQTGTGLYHPLTGREIEICQYRPDVAR